MAVRFLRHEIEKDAAPKDIKPSPPIVFYSELWYLYHQNRDHPFYVVNSEYGGIMIIAQFKYFATIVEHILLLMVMMQI